MWGVDKAVDKVENFYVDCFYPQFSTQSVKNEQLLIHDDSEVILKS